MIKNQKRKRLKGSLQNDSESGKVERNGSYIGAKKRKRPKAFPAAEKENEKQSKQRKQSSEKQEHIKIGLL